MLTLMKVGKTNNEVGFIYLNHEERKIEKIVINDLFVRDFFIGIDEENYNYLKLEKIMKAYMNLEGGNENLEFITNKIVEEGFFFAPNPSFQIYIENLE